MRRIFGFTLVELLIVIAILAILAAAVVIVINPGEMMAQARDAERISSIESLKKSIDLFVLDNPSASLGTSQRVYISIPSATAPACDASGLPILPTGWSYICSSAANLRKTDGTGWIPLNLGNIYGGSPISSLPIDPVNDSASGKYYTYVMGGSYELTALMEAEKTSASISDGGSLPGVLEAGTDLSLTPPTRDKGLVGYWTFDGTGSIANNQTTGLTDSSGKGNNGTASNANGTGMSFATGKKGNAIQLDGTDDYLNAGTGSSLKIDDKSFTLSVWIKPSTNIPTGGRFTVISTYSPGWIMDLCDDTDSEFYRFVSGPANYQYAPSGNLISLNWTHYVLVRNSASNKVYIYLDGVLKQSYNGGAVTSSTNPFLVGKRQDGYYFNGLIDEARVYNRALSDTEVKTIYDATK